MVAWHIWPRRLLCTTTMLPWTRPFQFHACDCEAFSRVYAFHHMSPCHRSTQPNGAGYSSQSLVMASGKELLEVPPNRNSLGRPMNTYLKVDLDSGTMDRLHQCAEQLARDFSPSVERVTLDQESKVRRKHYLRIHPRSARSLHMTFFFCGQVLCRMPQSELECWHENVASILKSSGFRPSSEFKDEAALETSSWIPSFESFHVRGLEVFPPHRKNLVVARLEPESDDWHKLYDQIIAMSMDDTISPSMAKLCQSQIRGKWLCHVTLANLSRSSPAQIEELEDYLASSLQFGTTSDGNYCIARTQGISLGGPIPQQMDDLCWNFELLLAERNPKSTRPQDEE